MKMRRAEKLALLCRLTGHVWVAGRCERCAQPRWPHGRRVDRRVIVARRTV
jgi:hypothetical protein